MPRWRRGHPGFPHPASRRADTLLHQALEVAVRLLDRIGSVHFSLALGKSDRDDDIRLIDEFDRIAGGIASFGNHLHTLNVHCDLSLFYLGCRSQQGDGGIVPAATKEGRVLLETRLQETPNDLISSM